MKIAFIPPMPHLDTVVLGDFIFALAQEVINNQRYAKDLTKLKETYSLPIMLDNGTFELQIPISDSLLIAAANIVNADIVVAPDIPFNREETLSRTKAFLETVKTLPQDQKRFKVMGVVQATTIPAYVESYKAFDKLALDYIGISILMDKHQFLRREAVKVLAAQKLLSTTKKHHLLGLDEPWELSFYDKYPKLMVSVDTSLPFSLGYHYKFIQELQAAHGREAVKHARVDRLAKLNKQQLNIALENCRFLKHLAEVHG